LNEKHDCGKLNSKRSDRYLLLIGGKRSSYGPKTLQPAGLNIQFKYPGLLALENAMRGTRVQLCQQLHRSFPDAKRDGHIDSVRGLDVIVGGSEVERD